MLARGILGDFLTLAGVACILAGSVINAAIIKKVNALLPREQRFSYFERSVVRMMRLPNEYRRFYPDGKMYIAMKTLTTLGIVCAFCYLCLRFL
jgi:hypothetical protein